MKKRNNTIFIEDILDSINKIESYVKGLNYKTFTENGLVIDAVIRNLEIIGEAAKSIPEKIRKNNDDIPWSKMIGLRNLTIHEYFGVDLSIIWEIITKNLPETKNKIEKLQKNAKILLQ